MNEHELGRELRSPIDFQHEVAKLGCKNQRVEKTEKILYTEGLTWLGTSGTDHIAGGGAERHTRAYNSQCESLAEIAAAECKTRCLAMHRDEKFTNRFMFLASSH